MIGWHASLPLKQGTTLPQACRMAAGDTKTTMHTIQGKVGQRKQRRGLPLPTIKFPPKTSLLMSGNV